MMIRFPRIPRATFGLLISALAVTGLGCKPDPAPDAGVTCTTVADCAAPANECVRVSCENQQCVITNAPAGTRVSSQTEFDCKVNACDGAGAVVVTNDDNDVPSDGNDCTDDVCSAGVASHPPRAADTACGTGGSLKCDGQGACVDCVNASDCGADTECQTRTCVAGVCGVNNVAAGTALAAQTDGDCKVEQCDGNGGTETVNADSDVPVDATSCTANVCTAGVPSNPPVAERTACTEGTGTLCDGAGACVACVTASDCPGSDTECQTRTCTAGVCGFSFAPQNTAVASQTDHDCKKNVCDGAGAIVPANDDTDLPNDNNECTTDTCVAGAPTFSNVTQGTTCGTGGTLVCNATGQCVGCNTASDCPGSDDECKTRTCSAAGVCGVTFTPNDTLVANQTANDCKHNVCDGSGNIVNRNDDADHPADDGNQCTSQTCVSGTPTFPAVAENTPCTQNGGSFCSTAGTCVACNAAAQCPGSDTECLTRTCVANVCGADFAVAGTVVTEQTAGDCKRNECDGAGDVVSVNLDSDVPADDGNQCTAQVCTAGVPSFPAAPPETVCSQNGGSVCNGTSCVQCNAPTDCPGSDNECQTRTCVENVCGFSFAPQNTVTAAQTAGDCKQNVCDGSGQIVELNFDNDTPADDGNQCTVSQCVNGTPGHANAPSGTTCSQGGTICDGSGQCVGCTADAQCPAGNACQVPRCNAGMCGFTNRPDGNLAGPQTPGDCKVSLCDNGLVITQQDNNDVPADDGNQCTSEVCVAGVPQHPLRPVDTACTQNGGSFCSETGACVACNSPSQCPGPSGECVVKTCESNTCDLSFVAAGTPTSSQTPNDCKQNECDGSGNVVSVNSSIDTPTDDGNQCTAEVCNSGVPGHPAVPVDTPCNQNGGSFCSATATCVGCNAPAQCPGTVGACEEKTCDANTCGIAYLPQGTAVATQTPGDCKQNECDGSGSIVVVDHDSDLPVDGNDCTTDLCTNGVPTNPNSPLLTSCAGGVCNGLGVCAPEPTVTSTTPADAATGVSALASMSITFSSAMDPASLTTQMGSGPCSGAIQLSTDNFTSCLGFSALNATMNGTNTVATVTAAPALAFGTTVRLRVTSAARSSLGIALAAAHTIEFTTGTDSAAGAPVVISQVYVNGGASGALYNADFIELHNRSSAPVAIGGWSVQYGSSGGNTWGNRINIPTGVVLGAGKYYLIQTTNAGSNGAALNSPDVTSNSISMAGAAGKVALVNTTTAIPNNTPCPISNPTVVDFVGYGSAANCWESNPTGGTAAAQAVTTAALRKDFGCQDTNDNSFDFLVAGPTPRNSGADPVMCPAPSLNEQNVGGELDYCVLQFPATIAVPTGTLTGAIYAQAYEAGSTEAAGPATNLVAEIGYGPVTVNPQNQSGWTWVSATFNTNVGSNDEWSASLTAPAPGVYKYTARFSYDGTNWTYCDLNGAGSNPGLTFETNQLGTLTVTP